MTTNPVTVSLMFSWFLGTRFDSRARSRAEDHHQQQQQQRSERERLARPAANPPSPPERGRRVVKEERYVEEEHYMRRYGGAGPTTPRPAPQPTAEPHSTSPIHHYKSYGEPSRHTSAPPQYQLHVDVDQEQRQQRQPDEPSLRRIDFDTYKDEVRRIKEQAAKGVSPGRPLEPAIVTGRASPGQAKVRIFHMSE